MTDPQPKPDDRTPTDELPGDFDDMPGNVDDAGQKETSE